MKTGEVAAHFADIDSASVSEGPLSRITDNVIEEMAEWQHPPLDRVYPVIFINSLAVNVPDGEVRNKRLQFAVAVTVNLERDILGIWGGDGGGLDNSPDPYTFRFASWRCWEEMSKGLSRVDPAPT